MKMQINTDAQCFRNSHTTVYGVGLDNVKQLIDTFEEITGENIRELTPKEIRVALRVAIRLGSSVKGL